MTILEAEKKVLRDHDERLHRFLFSAIEQRTACEVVLAPPPPLPGYCTSITQGMANLLVWLWNRLM